MGGEHNKTVLTAVSPRLVNDWSRIGAVELVLRLTPSIGNSTHLLPTQTEVQLMVNDERHWHQVHGRKVTASQDDFLVIDITKIIHKTLYEHIQVHNIYFMVETDSDRNEIVHLQVGDAFSPILAIYTDFRKNDLEALRSNKVVTKRSRRFATQEHKGRGPCHLKSLYVKPSLFLDSTGVIQPVRYEVNFCSGKCPSPLMLNAVWNATNHSHLLDLYRTAVEPQRIHIPRPSCVPIRYRSISTLYFDGPDVVSKVINDIAAQSCGCR